MALYTYEQWGIDLGSIDNPMDDSDQALLFSLFGYRRSLEEMRNDVNAKNRESPVFFAKVLNSRLPNMDNNTVLMQLLTSKSNANENFINTLLSLPGIDINIENNEHKNVTDLILDKIEKSKSKTTFLEYWQNLQEKIDAYSTYSIEMNKLSKQKQMEHIESMLHRSDSNRSIGSFSGRSSLVKQGTLTSQDSVRSEHALFSPFDNSAVKYTSDAVGYLSGTEKSSSQDRDSLIPFAALDLNTHNFSFGENSLDFDGDDADVPDQLGFKSFASGTSIMSISIGLSDDDDDSMIEQDTSIMAIASVESNLPQASLSMTVFEPKYKDYAKWYQNSKRNGNSNHPSKKHIFGNWCIDAFIGKGGFAKVYRAFDLDLLNKNKEHNVFVAIKLIQRKLEGRGAQDKKASKWLAANEIQCLKKINHVNVVNLLAYDTKAIYENIPMIAFILEYGANGDFAALITKLAPLSDVLARTYFGQIIAGIQACHEMNIVHRDIKLRNIVLDMQYNAKICDFGFAKVKINRFCLFILFHFVLLSMHSQKFGIIVYCTMI